jgi:ubiquinone/menaquinone biosynthesis C-methylase UbiE
MPESHPPPTDIFSPPRIEPSRLGIVGRILWAAASVFSVLLRFAFHLLYHQLAFTYDAVAWIVSGGEWADWRRCVLPFLPPGPVLEIAHGTGRLSLDMSERGFAVTALDLSPAMGKIAAGKKRKWLRRSHNSASPAFPKDTGRSADSPLFVRADVRQLPFREDYFASAVATFPAEFLFQRETFREVGRALRPGGRWIILPTAFPEWLAKRWLPEDQPNPPGEVWQAICHGLEECGFAAGTKIVRRPRSRVLLILAEKQGESMIAGLLEKS